MADGTVTSERLAPADQPTDDGQRALIALEAAWEVESIADALMKDAEPFKPEDLWKRALLVRIRDLACLTMSALDDDAEKVDALWVRLGIDSYTRNGGAV